MAAELVNLFGGGDDENFDSIRRESPSSRRRIESESSKSRPRRPTKLFRRPSAKETKNGRDSSWTEECVEVKKEFPCLRNSFSCTNLRSRGFTPTCPQMPSILPPEIEEGNIEYKRKLVHPSAERFEHLVTQMKWRLTEGNGEAIYELGVDDDGRVGGLSPVELEQSLSTLRRMAKRLGATTSVLRERVVAGKDGALKAVEVLVQRVPHSQTIADIRVAVLGNVDSGKSTLLGVLTQGELDNGRGRSRLNLFRHLHEVQSGRTSSISCELLGYDSVGAPVNYSGNRTVEDIVAESRRLVVLIDLAGHHKYQRTTLYGLTSYMPHYVVLVVSATTGMVETSRDHCYLAMALNVPLIVVISKVDLARPELSVTQVEEWLRSLSLALSPLRVETEEEADTAAQALHTEMVTPILCVSCVSGYGVDLLTRLLGQLPSAPDTNERTRLLQAPAEFWVGHVFDLACVPGVVLEGLLHAGVVHEGDRLRLGPLKDGGYTWVRVSSLQRNRLPHRCVQAGQTASVAVIPAEDVIPEEGEVDASGLDLLTAARRGSVLLGPGTAAPPPCWTLEASVHLMAGSAAKVLPPCFQTLLLCGNVCQMVEGKKGEQLDLRTEDLEVDESRTEPEDGGTLVTFRFLKHPELVRPGSTLFCRGHLHSGRGRVLRIHPVKSGPSSDSVEP